MKNADKLPSRCYATVSLDSLAHNMRGIKSLLGKQTKIMAILKADAYGHGYLEVAHTMIENGAQYLAVALVDEAAALRNHGIDLPLLMFSRCEDHDLEKIVDYDIMPSIYSLRDAQMLDKVAGQRDKIAKMHLKIDTGMGRIGFVHDKEQTIREIEAISKLEHCRIDGIFSHLACSDEEVDDLSPVQFSRFMDLCTELEQRGVDLGLKHICNSAATVRYPHMHLDMVRPGIISYGYYPSSYVPRLFDFLPVMEIKAKIIRVETLKAGSTVSYGATFTAECDMAVATVPIGYADGYTRLLGGRASMIVDGTDVPVCGRICMDQCMIDVTSVNTMPEEEDLVTIMGTCGGKSISADTLASLLGTINYEILCKVNKRVPRVYIKNGQVESIQTYLF